MKKIRIVTGFSQYTLTRFLQKAQMILLCMTSNANFPTPTPDLVTLGKAVDAYSIALANPASKANTALKASAVQH